ncbi:MAG: hypothetical protein O3C40_36495 [Planctomycetota bacterium]|nr:hypothetical protein [Planctomycetota bacterium]
MSSRLASGQRVWSLRFYVHVDEPPGGDRRRSTLGVTDGVLCLVQRYLAAVRDADAFDAPRLSHGTGPLLCVGADHGDLFQQRVGSAFDRRNPLLRYVIRIGSEAAFVHAGMHGQLCPAVIEQTHQTTVPPHSDKAGVHGKAANLSDLDAGDLKMSIDFRSVYANILADWLQIDPSRCLKGQHSPTDLLSV